MKALTLHQPWATLIALGVKTIETRSWRAPASLIGQHFAIHAGMQSDHAKVMEFDQVWHDHGFCFADDSLPLGAIVATARLVDCVPITDRRYMPDHGPQVTHNPATGTLRRVGSPLSGIFDDVTDQLPYGDFTPGGWAWLLDDEKPTTERCPACMGRGFDCGHARHGMSLGCVCATCDGDGTCPPIPAKGRQGLWRWEP